MTLVVDLNSDLGESFGAYTLGQDEKVLEHVTSANIACGFHAGDPLTMQHTVKLALSKGVSIGAHPSLPDLVGFGRREMQATAEEVYAMTVYQIGALAAFVQAEGGKLQHVKPHGALYNMAARDAMIARAIAEAVYAVDGELTLFALAHSELVRAGEACGLRVAREVFADRTYQTDGSLTSRRLPHSMIHDPEVAVTRVIRMIREGRVSSVDGADIEIVADTVCVHGDGPQALAFVASLRQALADNGIQTAPIGRRNG